MPMEEGEKLHSNMDANYVDIATFQSFVGSLLNLTNTKPNISYAVNCLSRFMSAPQLPAHLEVAKRVLHYIGGTDKYGGLLPADSDEELTTYVDSDWGRDLDKRKSTTRMIFKTGEHRYIGVVNYNPR